MFRGTVVALSVSLLVMAGLAAPAQATQPSAKKFSSCAKLLDKYPNGVARNKKARNRIVKQGFERPKVSKALYKRNGARLDRDGDGVMCEQEKKSLQPVELKFDWGFARVNQVDAPSPGQCVDVPVQFDIRNSSNLPIGLRLYIEDDFDNPIGYFPMTEDLPDGVNSNYKFVLCGQDWTTPPFIANGIGQDLKAATPGTYNFVVQEFSFGGVRPESAPYQLGG